MLWCNQYSLLIAFHFIEVLGLEKFNLYQFIFIMLTTILVLSQGYDFGDKTGWGNFFSILIKKKMIYPAHSEISICCYVSLSPYYLIFFSERYILKYYFLWSTKFELIYTVYQFQDYQQILSRKPPFKVHLGLLAALFGRLPSFSLVKWCLLERQILL